MALDYTTGKSERLRADDVDSPMRLIAYYQQELGGPLPVGFKRRSLMFKRMEEEMAWQRWGWGDLVASIQYMKNRHVTAGSFDRVYHYVRQAIAAGYTGENRLTSLEVSRQQALHVEKDENWVRKLSLANGEALRRLLDRWQEERGHVVGV